MIIQRVAAAVKRHDWSLFLLEVLVVVVGLFIGLQVDDWNESRKDQRREQLYLALIYGELAADVARENRASGCGVTVKGQSMESILFSNII
jgi:hypothetical protein